MTVPQSCSCSNLIQYLPVPREGPGYAGGFRGSPVFNASLGGVCWEEQTLNPNR